MSSKLRSETARLNGAKSRGPTTTAGLEKSSRNALKHGLTTQSAIVLACESQAEFDIILNQFLETYKPADPAELDLVQEMVACRWRIRRLWGIETSLLDDEFDNQKSTGAADSNRVHLAKAFRALADESRSLALAARYESRLHRIYNQAYATFRELQQARESRPPTSPLEPYESASVPDPAGSPADPETDEAAKRTQDTTKALESNNMEESDVSSKQPGPPPTSSIQDPTSNIRLSPPARLPEDSSGPSPAVPLER